MHDEAASAEATDWPQILALYELLLRISDNPVVALNHAVAVAMTHGPGAGLERLGRLETDRRITADHRLEAVRAHLLEMAGQHQAARAAYQAAARRATEPAAPALPQCPGRPSGPAPMNTAPMNPPPARGPTCMEASWARHPQASGQGRDPQAHRQAGRRHRDRLPARTPRLAELARRRPARRQPWLEAYPRSLPSPGGLHQQSRQPHRAGWLRPGGSLRVKHDRAHHRRRDHPSRRRLAQASGDGAGNGSAGTDRDSPN